LLIEHVKVRAPWQAPNTDALDPGSCTNVLIRDCDIDTGDDDICIKTGGTNILVENCAIKHGHGISIGSGTTGGIHNMLVRNCTMEDTLWGIRIKSMRGAGGPVENIRYSNIQMKNVQNAINLYLDYVDNNRPDFKGPANLIPSIKHIELDNITATGAQNAGRIAGIAESPIIDITLKNVSITAENDWTIEKADHPILENVNITVKPGVAPVLPPFIE
jgi:polygalacturonase